MADNRPGMSHREAEQRLTRIAAGGGHPMAKQNLANSIVNQVRVREGEGAARDLVRKFSR